MTNTLLFNAPADRTDRRGQEHWKVLVADDEQGVHDVTRLALKKFDFQDKKIEFFHTFSGQETREFLTKNDDIAVLLLDVVMEDDDAGLKTAEYIRNTLKNSLVRIILRTGQPGAAPEEEVIRNYDINDYKDKTELTVQKLKTTMYSALRSYRDLRALEQHRKGLSRVIDSTSNLFQKYELSEFVSGILEQISSVIGLDSELMMATGSKSIFLAGCDENDIEQDQLPKIVSGSGRFRDAKGKYIDEVLRHDDLVTILKSIKQQESIIDTENCVFFFSNHRGQIGLIYLTECNNISDVSLNLMKLFSTNISIAYDNVSLYQEIDDTQKEVLFRLGTIAEFRSKETSQHVNRVARYSELLALKYGLSETEAKLVRMASPMHDIGKIGIPDSILQKPGKLTDDEFKVMKTHCQLGFDMLDGSDRPVLKTAATIALEHQEKWDGSGYPQGLKGDQIHIYGRITALADVFDALGSERCYKKAWPLEKILELFRVQSGKHFDPQLMGLFFENLDQFLVIRDRLADD